MDRSDAIRRIVEEGHVIAPGQPYVIDRFRPGDAWGVARLFHAVYGDGYPADRPYIPEQLIAAHANSSQMSAVARTPGGDIVGHVAVYRSSPPHPGLYELGEGAVLPAYRGQSIIRDLQLLAVDECAPSLPVDALYGEAVTSSLATQRTYVDLRFWLTGIELGLMPSAASADGGAPVRGSVVLGARSYRDRPQCLHVPAIYRPIIEEVLAASDIRRTVVESVAPAPAASRTECPVSIYAAAGVMRANIAGVGADVDEAIDRLEAQADAAGVVTRQCFVALGEPWAGRAFEALGSRGYFFGGYVPRWFDADALLVQKLSFEPDYDRIRLFAPFLERLLAYIRADQARVAGPIAARAIASRSAD